MSNKAIESIPALYESYFLRDITYSLSGAISIFAITLPFEGMTATLIEAMEEHAAIFLGFLAMSYVLGLLLQDGFTAIGIFRMQPDIPRPYATRHALMSDIRENCGAFAIRELERTIYLKHVGSGIGSSSVIAAILFAVSGFARIPAFFLGTAFSILVLVVSIYLNRSKMKEQNLALSEFAEKLQAKDIDAG